MPFKESFNQSRVENKVESPQLILEQLMKNISRETNESLDQVLLDEHGTIIMNSFQETNDGPYDEAVMTHDEQHVTNKKLEFSGAYNYPAESKQRQDRLDQWQKHRAESKPELLEMAVTAIFHKALGDKFLVTRSASYDDYVNGIDNVIVNRETGDVVCAFDEVHDQADGKYVQEKNDKIINKAIHGGAQLKYGLSFHKKYHSLIKMPLKNIPVFYLAMDNEHLDTLLADISTDSHQLTKTELSVFEQFINSLETQQQLLLNQANLPTEIRSNLEKFSQSLELMSETKERLTNHSNK
jgi:hypothetical protein